MKDDLIPRSAVKETIKSVKEKGNIYCSVKPGKNEETPHAFVILRKALDAVDAIPAVEAEWISVEERLPEYGTCLVVVKYKYGWEDHYNYDVDFAQLCYENDPYRIDGKWVTFNDWDEGQDEIHVTHWMPLPEPPKGVQ